MSYIDVTKEIRVGSGEKLLLMAGPCQIESEEHCLKIAAFLKELCSRYPVNLVFKASFDKANRTSLQGQRGPGLAEGLKVLKAVKEKSGLPVVTDVHFPEQAEAVAAVVDMLQIPAFLCRQTDLLLAAGRTGKPVNCKKGQFMHPADMRHVADKIASTGNKRVMLCERGTSFGYRDLVFDPRSISIMQETGCPVIFDATHCVQSMGGEAGSSGGARQYVLPLARAAIAVGADGLFIECHDNPDVAPSDGPSMLKLEQLEDLLKQVCALRASLRG